MRQFILVKKTVKTIIFVAVLSVLVEGSALFLHAKWVRTTGAEEAVLCNRDALGGAIQTGVEGDFINVSIFGTAAIPYHYKISMSGIDREGDIDINSPSPTVQFPKMAVSGDTATINIVFTSSANSLCAKNETVQVYINDCPAQNDSGISLSVPTSIDLNNADGVPISPVPTITINYGFSGRPSTDYYHLFIADSNGSNQDADEGWATDSSKSYTLTPNGTSTSYQITIKTFFGGPGTITSQCPMTGRKNETVTVNGASGGGGGTIPDGGGAGGTVAIGDTISVLGLTFTVPKSITDFSGILDIILAAIGLIVGLLAFFGIVVGGIQYITSGGDSAKAEKAKKTIIYSVIGIILTVLAYTITIIVVKIIE